MMLWRIPTPDVDWIVALPELIEAALDALGVIARLAQMSFQAVAVAATRSHCDLRLQHGDERLLHGMRLTEVLHNLLFRLVVHWSSGFL